MVSKYVFKFLLNLSLNIWDASLKYNKMYLLIDNRLTDETSDKYLTRFSRDIAKI